MALREAVTVVAATSRCRGEQGLKPLRSQVGCRAAFHQGLS